MHGSVWLFSHLFFTWCHTVFEPTSVVQILDIGAYDWNGNLRTSIARSELSKRTYNYTGVDMEKGPNVDVVLRDPYETWPFQPDSTDIIISCSALEHDKFFWLTFLRIVHILKPGGFLLMMVPSNMPAHRYPVDSWRFLEDAPDSLVQWARYNKHDVHLVYSEIFPNERFHDTTKTVDGVYTDAIAIYWKSNFVCTHSDVDICATQAALHNNATSEDYKSTLSHLTYSFLRNIQKLGEVGGFKQPSEIGTRIAQIESTFAEPAIEPVTGSEVVPTSAEKSAISAPLMLGSVKQDVQWIDRLVLEYVLCGFRIPIVPAVPLIDPNTPYISYSITLYYPSIRDCRITRGLTLTEARLSHRHLLQEATAEFARVFLLPDIDHVEDLVWAKREEFLAILNGLRSGATVSQDVTVV